MTRKDWEKIENVIKYSMSQRDRDVIIPEYPSAEWLRRVIARSLCDVFNLKGEAEIAFLRHAGIPLEQERTFK